LTVAACKGRALENIRFRHPFYDRTAPIYLGEYVTLDTGTGIVHSAPAYGVEDFESCRRYGMQDEEILTRCWATGSSLRRCRSSAGSRSGMPMPRS
jgi:isoleucyl-tRNA synthetase